MNPTSPYDTAGASRPKNTAQFGYAPPPVPVPGYFAGAANAGAQSAPKFAASTPYTSVEGAGSGGAGLRSWSVGMSSSQIGDILRSQGMRGPGADVLARFARRSGAGGAPADVQSFMATGMNRRDASAVDYLNSLRATTQARQGAQYDANLNAYKAGLTKQYELAAPASLAGVDPSAYQRTLMQSEAEKARLANERAGVDLGTARTSAEQKAYEVWRERENARIAAGAAPSLGYVPTGEQLHARSMVDHNATSSARVAGVARGAKTEGFYAERETAKREAEAAKISGEQQALADAKAAADQRAADQARGAPIVSPDGKFFWNGKSWASVTSREDAAAELAAARQRARDAVKKDGGKSGEAVAAPVAPQFDAGKVYVQNGKRYTTTDGKTFNEVK